MQEEADWLRLFLFKNKVGNIAKIATWVHSTNLVCSIPHQQNLLAHQPHQMASVQKETVELLLFKMKSIMTRRHDHLPTWQSLATFSSKILLLKWVMPVKEYCKYTGFCYWINHLCSRLRPVGSRVQPLAVKFIGFAVEFVALTLSPW